MAQVGNCTSYGNEVEGVLHHILGLEAVQITGSRNMYTEVLTAEIGEFFNEGVGLDQQSGVNKKLNRT